jgi:hypothetical protein
MWYGLTNVYALKTYVTFLLLYLNCKVSHGNVIQKFWKGRLNCDLKKHEQFTQELYLFILINKSSQQTNQDKWFPVLLDIVSTRRLCTFLIRSLRSVNFKGLKTTRILSLTHTHKHDRCLQNHSKAETFCMFTHYRTCKRKEANIKS